MYKFLMIGAAVAGLGFATAAPASAQAARPDPGLTSSVTDSVTQVQYRRGFGGPRFGGPRFGGPRFGGPRYYGRGYYGGGYRRGYGGAAAGLGLGLATGAIIGGAIASQQQAPVYGGGGDTTAYCLSRFKSYDPRSGTYLGYDGLRHPCP